jgi:hypothetical protein
MDRRKLNIHIKILFYLIVKGNILGKQKAKSGKQKAIKAKTKQVLSAHISPLIALCFIPSAN